MKKTLLQRIIIGIKKGWNTPNLPPHILQFHLNPFIRVLRVIGWIATLSYLSGKLNSFPYPKLFVFIAVIIIFINFIYFIYISFMQFKHVIKVWKSDELDV